MPAQVAYPGCKVLAGRWLDANTGTTYEDPADVSIDGSTAAGKAPLRRGQPGYRAGLDRDDGIACDTEG